MNFRDLYIDRYWSLFLDRDGVINKRIPGDYIRTWEQFEFLPGVLEAFVTFDSLFKYIFVVTNQQGIGKDLMTVDDLHVIHKIMSSEIFSAGGRLDKTYFSPYLEEMDHPTRKPGTGMAEHATADFPDIDRNKSIMVGDSESDMLFGKNAGMVTIFCGNSDDLSGRILPDLCCKDLKDFSQQIQNTGLDID